MAFFNEFPNTRTYDSDLGWLIATVDQILTKLGGYDQITFADPITWNITAQYPANIIVRDGADGPLYISKKPVPNGILLTNTDYWENLGIYDGLNACRIINVADYGALGVEDADYTTEIQNALDAGDIIYFPTGYYSFGTVYTSTPKFIFGDGDATIWKPLHRIITSNQYKTMLQSAGDLIIDSIKFVGNNSVATQTGAQYYQTAIIQQMGGNFRMTRCTIDQIFDTYHLSQGDLEFYDRNGLLLYVSDADSAEIDRCTFKQYGGEELAWISRAIAHFGDPAPVRVHDNNFIDKVMLDGGGLIDGGSVINVLGGTCEFYNNSADNYYERGSWVNLLANIVEIYDNTVVNSDMSSVIDCSEGYYGKAQYANIHNNHFEDPNGVTTYSIKAQARKLHITDNYFEAICPVKTYAMIDPSLLAAQAYIAAGESWTDYDEVVITNNEIILSEEAGSALNSCISIGQSNSSAGSRGTLKFCKITGNTIRRSKTFTNYFVSIVTYMKNTKTVIDGNTFDNIGTGVPSGSRNNLVAFAEALASGAQIVLTNNFVEDPLGTAVTLITGIAAGLTNGTYFASGNVLSSSYSGTKTITTSTLSGNLTADYNLGFSANAG